MPKSNWHDEANCRGLGDEGYAIFFPEIKKGDGGAKLKALYAPALELCSACPAKKPCLESQLKHEKETLRFDGVWGGTTPEQRKEILSKREWDARLRR